MEIDLYLLEIDASIKANNPEKSMIEEGMNIASNDPSILLRKMAIEINEFETNRLNDINIGKVIKEIEVDGEEGERKMHERFGDSRDACLFSENRNYLEECYKRHIYLCKKKGVKPDIEEKSRIEF
jgi:hypothetical protein